jgi:hypothetical protein
LIREHNPHSFLTGDTPFLLILKKRFSPKEFTAELLFEHHHEGAIGLPHGGLAMGLCLDAWRFFDFPTYPVRASFRFGGSGLKLGESAILHAEITNKGQKRQFQATITKQGESRPYLKTVIVPMEDEASKNVDLGDPGGVQRLLPYYRNCFVCGRHRDIVGLERRFRFHHSDRFMGVSVCWGDEKDDVERARCFLIGAEELHPAVITSIFDENTGWAGFMGTKAAGLTVRMDLTLLRPLGAQEQLLFVSHPDGVRGNSKNPRFFVARGFVFSLGYSGNPTPVAYGHGEWIILDSITAQVKQNLLPVDDWQWIFEGR